MFTIFINRDKSSATIAGKISGTKWSNLVKPDRERKVWYVLLRVF